MRRLVHGLVRYATLMAITGLAVAAMWWVSFRQATDPQAVRRETSPVPAVAQPRFRVAVESVDVETVEVTATFTGKIRPWETYQLAFEVPGRVAELGRNQVDQPLDDGDRVEKGQLLARLDDRIFQARKSEASAQLEEAATEMRRFRTLRERSLGAITDSEFQTQLTQLALTRAQLEVALKNLDDAVLNSPVDATISRRRINVGESVSANQLAFELVQNDEVLLVVDVPEAQIRELELRLRTVEQNKSLPPTVDIDSADREFRAYVHLQGRDRFGALPPPVEGEVYRVAQVADSRTGLFEVEIRVPNQDRMLRAGMVANAVLVTDRIQGYRVPDSAVIFRNREAYLFTVDEQPAPMQVMFWEFAEVPLHAARRVSLQRWIEAGPQIVIPADEQSLQAVVVRGQERLADGQIVRIVDHDSSSAIASPGTKTARADSVSSRPNPPGTAPTAQ